MAEKMALSNSQCRYIFFLGKGSMLPLHSRRVELSYKSKATGPRQNNAKESENEKTIENSTKTKQNKGK